MKVLENHHYFDKPFTILVEEKNSVKAEISQKGSPYYLETPKKRPQKSPVGIKIHDPFCKNNPRFLKI